MESEAAETVELTGNAADYAKVVEEIVRVEKKIFPKHESLSKSFESELSKKNSGLLYALVNGEIVGYVMYSWPSSLSASITKLAGRPLELVDPTLRNSYTSNEVIRCIHIGLLCVQDNLDDRPTMASVILMLDNYSISMPSPLQPAFFIHSRMDPNFSMTDKSTSKSMTVSVNEVSLTEIYPR